MDGECRPASGNVEYSIDLPTVRETKRFSLHFIALHLIPRLKTNGSKPYQTNLEEKKGSSSTIIGYPNLHIHHTV